MEQFIKETIREAGKIILEGFNAELEVSAKGGGGDVVTQYDKKVEEFIAGQIRKNYPDAGILSEEGGDIKKADKFFIIDPIDGTRNFSRKIPVSCSILGYIEGNVVQAGAVYDPYRNELFYAETGRGATLNGKKISVAPTVSLERAIFTTGITDNYFPGTKAQVGEKPDMIVMKYHGLNHKIYAVGLAEVYVAAGRYDICLMAGMGQWDLAAPALILQEAGAKVTDIDGRPYQLDSRSMIAANPVLHDKFMKELTSYETTN